MSHRAIAYLLISLPIVWSVISPHPHPVPQDLAIQFYVTLGVAIGAGLYVVRRRRGDVVGWLGLAGWGSFCLIAIVHALIGR